MPDRPKDASPPGAGEIDPALGEIPPEPPPPFQPDPKIMGHMERAEGGTEERTETGDGATPRS